MIPNSTEEDLWGIEKRGVLHFGGIHPTARMSCYVSVC